MLKLIALLFIFTASNVYANFLGYSIRLGSPTISYGFASEEKNIEFEPNPLSDVTLSFIGPSYAFGLQFTGENEDDTELFESRFNDFLISYYSESLLVDIFFRSFEDFYVLDDKEEMIAANSADTVKGSSLGAQMVYYFKGSVFQLHGEIVLNPTTSWGYFTKLRFDHSNLEGSGTIIPTKYQNDFRSIADLETISNDSLEGQMGIAGMYAWDHFFINSFLMLGPSIDSFLLEGDKSTSKILVSPISEAFLGVAYYYGELQIGLRSLARLKVSDLNSVNYNQLSGTSYLYFQWLF